MVEYLTIKDLNTGTAKHFDVDGDVDYLLYEGCIDWGNVSVTHNTFQFPQQIGMYISNTVLGSRDIAINGWIIGDTSEEINGKKMALSLFVNPLHEYHIDVDGYFIGCKPTSNVTFGKEYSENNEVCVKFLLQFTCAYPLFLLNNAINVDIAGEFGAFHFPLTIPKNNGIIMGYRKQSMFTEMVNNGSIDVGMIITITASGIVDNPELINVNTKERLKINKILEPGEQVIINTNIGERSVIGIKDHTKYNYLRYLDYDSTWLQLVNGQSLFTYKTYDNEGNEDETYKRMEIMVSYQTALFNLEEE